MLGEFYSLPISFGDLMKKKDIPRCSLIQSVAQNLHLMLTTHYGENRNNPKFGCSIWENEFEVLSGNDSNKEGLRESIKKTIAMFEKRITNVEVSLDFKQEQLISKSGTEKRIKRKIEISITGNLVKTNESCSFNDKFFVGPISFN